MNDPGWEWLTKIAKESEDTSDNIDEVEAINSIVKAVEEKALEERSESAEGEKAEQEMAKSAQVRFVQDVLDAILEKQAACKKKAEPSESNADKKDVSKKIKSKEDFLNMIKSKKKDNKEDKSKMEKDAQVRFVQDVLDATLEKEAGARMDKAFNTLSSIAKKLTPASSKLVKSQTSLNNAKALAALGLGGGGTYALGKGGQALGAYAADKKDETRSRRVDDSRDNAIARSRLGTDTITREGMVRNIVNANRISKLRELSMLKNLGYNFSKKQ